MARWYWSLAVVGMLSLACGSDDEDTNSKDNTQDGGGGNGGANGSGGANAGANGGADAGANAGSDTDAGATGGSNAGEDPGAAAGVVACGDSSCSMPNICCVSFLGGANGGFECKAQNACTGLTSAPGTCDGKEDCTGGQACCAKFALTGGSGAFCEASCTGDTQALCHKDSDCDQGKTCIPCAPPTGGIIDLVYHLCSATTSCPSPYMNVTN